MHELLLQVLECVPGTRLGEEIHDHLFGATMFDGDCSTFDIGAEMEETQARCLVWGRSFGLVETSMQAELSSKVQQVIFG